MIETTVTKKLIGSMNAQRDGFVDRLASSGSDYAIADKENILYSTVPTPTFSTPNIRRASVAPNGVIDSEAMTALSYCGILKV